METAQRAHLSLLVHLAKVDDSFAVVEEDMIRNIGQDYGLPTQTIDELIEEPDEIEDLDAIGLDLDLKFQSIYDCIQMMLVDGIIHKKEIAFCQSVADKLGFSRDLIQYLTDHRHDSSEVVKRSAYEMGII
ncbi:MAG: TerB family tellurite resistance protein [Cyclobacteriaceae bacterium]